MRLKIYFKNGRRLKIYGPYFMANNGKGFHHISKEEYSRLKKIEDQNVAFKKTRMRLEKNISPKKNKEIMKRLYQAAGYNIYGTTLCINPKEFFKIESTKVRFNLLCEEDAKLLKSPEKLLETQLQAWTSHKQYNARGIKNNLAECFKEVLEANLSPTENTSC